MQALSSRRIVFDGDELYIDSPRYFTFKKDNCTCVKCGLKGAFFAKEKPSKIGLPEYVDPNEVRESNDNELQNKVRF